MSKMEDFRKELRESLKQYANDHGLKRPFVLKTRSMQGKIPKDALPSEKGFLEHEHRVAYEMKNKQELYEEIARSLEKILKDHKKNPQKTIKEVDYKKYKYYDNLNSEDKAEVDFQLGKRLLNGINEQISQKQINVELFENTIKVLKKTSTTMRKNKQMLKENFEDCLEEVKYGIKLAKKYGELKYKIDQDNEPKSCEYDEKWYNHKNDEKLSYERRIIIQKMEEPN